MSLFNGTEKKEALRKFESAKTGYEKAIVSLNEVISRLFEKRKEGSSLVKDMESKLKCLDNIDQEYIARVSEARETISFFLESVKKEDVSLGKDSSGKATGAAVLGTAAGTAIATLGTTTTMAVVTTFGTAATGTAISALSGAAATNAALAAIGGGALAAGGGGIAAGSAILAAIPVIGWTIGGAAALGGGFMIARNNRKCAEEAEQKAKELQRHTWSINKTTREIRKCLENLDGEINELKPYAKPGKQLHQDNDFLDNIVSTVERICSLINKKFS